MAQSNRYFYYLPEYQLLVCKDCKYAVCLRQVRTHLQGTHHGLEPRDTATVLADVQHK